MKLEVKDIEKQKYKSTSKISTILGICKVIKVIIFGIMVFLLLGLMIDVMDCKVDMSVWGPILTSLCIMFVIYLFVTKTYKFVQNANLYVNSFREDVDGYIKISDLAFYVGQNETVVINNFSKLLKKGYIVNCTIENKNNINYIVLNNSILKQAMKENTEINEMVMEDIKDFNTLKNYKCPNCGNSMEIRDVNNVVCKYCRSKYILDDVKRYNDVNIKTDSKESYVNYPKMTIGLIVAIPSVMFFTVWLIGSVGAMLENIEEISKQVTMIIVFITFIVLSIYLLLKNAKRIGKFAALSSYDMYFKNHQTGIVKIEDFAAKFNMSEQKAIQKIIIFIQQNYLKNCRLEKFNDGNYLVLNKTIKQSINEDSKYKEIILKDIEEYNMIQEYPCPNCGATINIKDKENVVCDYCRTRLHFKRLIDNKKRKH